MIMICSISRCYKRICLVNLLGEVYNSCWTGLLKTFCSNCSTQFWLTRPLCAQGKSLRGSGKSGKLWASHSVDTSQARRIHRRSPPYTKYTKYCRPWILLPRLLASHGYYLILSKEYCSASVLRNHVSTVLYCLFWSVFLAGCRKSCSQTTGADQSSIYAVYHGELTFLRYYTGVRGAKKWRVCIVDVVAFSNFLHWLLQA